ncbi:4-(cytidine 5'-diphospho)-2-C-methyl-D-erythritol kinase [Miniphocaeibacter halophilus]|uniref:4-(Cytidine 5'-diphospho)-2-C-methyl-D-erythritol kinase n=1 Tax=Miniphocaeibacter halophilus TaxID=2931922 RepID=A0AC61MQR9_9FIRM|nr:4-(cytidine 5'-diphospho)-2-C-methyl-D-erythritol kinase [Miniphocaeibacter halophilus]QQK07977.1 4-(cytidine 5'-diphospho)-2-C-methyl-D-erythritol kinase [Miniphocaeibacter halophilus]
MYKINSYGKINLSLDIINKREDGYHNIDTIMQLIDLKDILYIEENKFNNLKISCNNKEVPTDENNLVYKAWNLLKKYKENDYGLNVEIDKKIPIAAGLAGGSSNAAYFMKAINDIWKLNLSNDELKQLGKKIGADLPFFFEEGTVRAEGIGDVFSPVKNFKNINVLIVNNGYKISTEYVYKKIKPLNKNKIEKCIKTIEEGKPFKKEFYYNAMTEISAGICPQIHEIIDELYSLNASVALMSGSGSTVFALYEQEDGLNNAYNKLKNKYEFVYKTKTL